MKISLVPFFLHQNCTFICTTCNTILSKGTITVLAVDQSGKILGILPSNTHCPGSVLTPRLLKDAESFKIFVNHIKAELGLDLSTILPIRPHLLYLIKGDEQELEEIELEIFLQFIWQK